MSEEWGACRTSTASQVETPEYFLGRVGSAPVVGLVQEMVDRLVRMDAPDEARLRGDFLVLIDRTGYPTFLEVYRCSARYLEESGQVEVEFQAVVHRRDPSLEPG